LCIQGGDFKVDEKSNYQIYKVSEVTMIKTNEFISIAESLPIEIRIQRIIEFP